MINYNNKTLLLRVTQSYPFFSKYRNYKTMINNCMWLLYVVVLAVADEFTLDICFYKIH